LEFDSAAGGGFLILRLQVLVEAIDDLGVLQQLLVVR